MENLFSLIAVVIISVLIALLGKNRSIGFGWSLLLCLFLSPLVGLIITLCSKRVNKKEFREEK